ncbi:MAG: hypothetical protein K2F92_07330 [Alistipes sp.]|nr:hypothetical protein [Alistipes sp.]
MPPHRDRRRPYHDRPREFPVSLSSPVVADSGMSPISDALYEIYFPRIVLFWV